MRRPYLTPARLTELRDGLGQEQLVVLAHLQVVRIATARQLQALAGVLNDASATRRFRRLLAQMTEQRLIARLDRVIGGARSGSGGFVYRLDIAGQRLAGGSENRRPWTPRPSWLNHALAVTQLYVDLLAETARSATIKLVSFQAEPACWRQFSEGYGQLTTLKPDAYLQLLSADYESHFYVEIDQGTESPATLERKLAVYYHFWLAGGAEQTNGVMPLVIWIVPDGRRLEVVRQVLGRQSGELRNLHRVVVADEAVKRLVEGPH
jgi:hypothetical protein